MRGNRQVGMYGENLAANYLLLNGYDIVDRNFRTRAGEIDLVSKRDNVYTFTEVKTRRSTHYGSPEEAVDQQKWERIQEIASVWLERHKMEPESPFKMDIISVQLNRDGTSQLVRIGDYGI